MRQAKSQLHKVQQQVEQARNQVWNLAESVQKGEDVLSALASHLTAFPHLQDEMRQAREQLGRLQERQLANQSRIEDAMRQQQTVAERQREEHSVSLRRLEAVERLVQSYEGRMLAVEEVGTAFGTMPLSWRSGWRLRIRASKRWRRRRRATARLSSVWRKRRDVCTLRPTP